LNNTSQELLGTPDPLGLKDLIVEPCNFKTPQDAYATSSFDTFVRPTLNPRLTKFSIDLTAITQEQVDAAPTIDKVLDQYMKWLASINLLESSNGNRIGNWCFCTWGDGDIMQTLREELAYKSIAFPPCFDRWINLKDDSVFKRHYGREPKGGLRACVESSYIGATWQGRAHNGFVDSVNTAKIVRHMVQTGYRFTRSTRGLGRNGVPFGQASANIESPNGASSSSSQNFNLESKV
jgi:inhibitor of KinA sporulation pathway (predicted exonuclease)